jgi:hypothetical protein
VWSRVYLVRTLNGGFRADVPNTRSRAETTVGVAMRYFERAAAQEALNSSEMQAFLDGLP